MSKRDKQENNQIKSSIKQEAKKRDGQQIKGQIKSIHQVKKVLLSEIKAETSGTMWLGAGEGLTAIVFAEKVGVLLRGWLLREWLEGGQLVRKSSRNISIRIKEMVLVSTYFPVFTGYNDIEIDEVKEDLKEHSKWATKEEILVIGGDFNSHIGGGEERPRVCGKFGLRESNQQGSKLLDFCEENGLAHVNSYYNHKRRGSWFHPRLRRWYELDGFLMKNYQRQGHVKKVCTIGEASISDHKPKLITIRRVKERGVRQIREKRIPQINWEKLRLPEFAARYKQVVQGIIADEEYRGEGENVENTTKWNSISEIVLKAAEEVLGKKEKKIENPWMVGREQEVQALRTRITGALTRRNDISEEINEEEDIVRVEHLQDQLETSKNELKEARKELQRKTRSWENEWWQERINECEQASERGDSGTVYRTLKLIGIRDIKKAPDNTTITKEQFRDHFKQVSEERFENTPEVIMEVVNEIEDVFETERAEVAREWRERLEQTPSKEEILEQMKMMKDTSPGKDGVRLNYLLQAGQELLEKVVEMVQFMFNNPAELWEESLKIGLVIPLHKKGSRNDPNKYRGVCLLPMGSRIVGRVAASRLRLWAEALDLMDDELAGFRKGRSTADVAQIMIRIQEDATDLRNRITAEGGTIPEDDLPSARLLDLRKAYPRVNKFAMWEILKKNGIGEKFLRVVQDLHETTEYRIKGREGESEPWVPLRGLREGGASSPILFNVLHQVPMRVAAKQREEKGRETGLEVGLAIKWVPGSSFPATGLWEKPNSEAIKINIKSALFADDTTGVGRKKELDQGVEIMKEVMNKIEEKNNEDKEEVLEFGHESSNTIRMLGSYMGPDEDIKQRIKRAGAAWSKVRKRLKGSKLSKKVQARIVEACVESTALFDSQIRTWQVREIKRVQSMLDKCYRYVWSRNTKPPLIQMQEEGKNMQDVRNELKVTSVRIKIEKRTLERIGHVMRMDDDRQVKAVTLGWLEDLENHEKRPGKKRKTMLYWKKLVKEAGLDYTRIDSLTKDRKIWKSTVKERVSHLKEWERRGGHKVNEVRGDRNNIPNVDNELMCDYEDCGKVCRSKAGLVNHIRRIHEISKNKAKFKCVECGESFKLKGNLVNHKRICTKVRASQASNRKCNVCQREVSKSNFARHYRSCQDQHGVEAREPLGIVAARGPCNICGIIMRKSNLARHKNNNCIGGAAIL